MPAAALQKFGSICMNVTGDSEQTSAADVLMVLPVVAALAAVLVSVAMLT